ncbi:TPA: hypothetical protein GNC42_003879 [Salmonella enterica subsp. enterica serovar Gallinarum]|nr:hypothetical protein [Salmonella enterica subsp. enterica serovar Gallinarum]HAF7561882.1 hypothetical protein [Salmonella enterica subsp. enterica serovar Gallinarum]
MKKNPVSIPHSIWLADDIKRLERDAADAFGLTLYELCCALATRHFG